LFVMLLIQLIRIHRYKGFTFTYPGAQYAMLLFVCFFRFLMCMDFSNNLGQVPIAMSAIITVIPYMLLFWVYSLLIFQWAGAHHFAMSTGGAGWKKTRLPFIIVNIIVSIGTFVLFGSLLMVTTNSQRDTVVLAGSTIMATITFVTALGFAIYGGLIFHSLSKGAPKADRAGKKSPRCCKTLYKIGSLPRRLFIVTITFSISFTGEAVMWMLSATTPNYSGRTSDIVTALYLGFDVVCVLSMLYLFFNTINAYAKPANKEKEAEQAGSTGPLTPNRKTTKGSDTKKSPQPTHNRHGLDGRGASVDVDSSQAAMIHSRGGSMEEKNFEDLIPSQRGSVAESVAVADSTFEPVIVHPIPHHP